MRISDWSSDVCSSDLGKGNAIAIIGIAHGAEFIHSKRPPSQTGTFLHKKYRLAHVPMDRNRRDKHHWRQEQQSEERACNVDQPFHPLPLRSEERRVGKACDITSRSRG